MSQEKKTEVAVVGVESSTDAKAPSLSEAHAQQQADGDVIAAKVITDPRAIVTFKPEPGHPIALVTINGDAVGAFSDPALLAEFLPGPALYQAMGQLLAALEASGGRGEDAKRKLNAAVGHAVVVMGQAQELRGYEAPRLITLQ